MSQTNEPIVKFSEVTKRYGDLVVLDKLDLEIKKNEMISIIGPSGSGKTTLIKCMVGLHMPDSGKILFNNQSIDELDKKSSRKLRKEIGMLFQGGALFDYLNVEENIAFPLNMFTNLSQKEKIDRVNFCLNRVNLNNVNKMYHAE